MSEEVKRSEIGTLLIKNSSTEEGLTIDERARAEELILNPEVSEDTCEICEMLHRSDPNYRVDSAIYDTNLCQGHAFYALRTRK